MNDGWFRFKTHCKRGHAIAEHAYYRKSGTRECGLCRKLRRDEESVKVRQTAKTADALVTEVLRLPRESRALFVARLFSRLEVAA
jgi:hypothetical protein